MAHMIWRSIGLTMVLLGVGAVAAPAAEDGADPASSDAEDAPLDVATILSRIADDGAYKEASNCLRVRAYNRVEVLDDRHLLFHGKREVWLNRLRHRCSSLRSDQILVFERQGTQICDTDRVSGRDRFETGIWYGSCMLGTFELIDEQQAMALKEALEAARHTKHGRPDRSEQDEEA